MTYRDPLRDVPTMPDMEQPTHGKTQDAHTDEAADSAMQKGQDIAGKVSDTASEKGQQIADKAEQMGSKAQEKAGEFGSKAQDKADEGMQSAASGLGQAADTLRSQGEQRGGTVGGAATMAADKLDTASHYLRDKDTDQLLGDLESLVRRKPVESLVAAAGIGFVLSKIFR